VKGGCLDDSGSTLTIGDPIGECPGMPNEITFDVVWVFPQHGVGEAVESGPDKVVQYRGMQILVEPLK
jgi:hypothetical protein